MTRICRENTSHSSFLSLTSSLDNDFSSHNFHHHQTPPPPLHPPPPPPPPSPPHLPPSDGNLAGDSSSGEVGSNMGLPLNIDLGLLSCTESLGFESSDEISTVGFGSCCTDRSSSSSSCSNVEDESASSSSSRSTTSFWNSSSRRRWSERREFPPALSRNFVLRSERKDGRLEIVRVEIERPEVLYASRHNGRLTMHLVREEEEEEEDDVLLEEDENDVVFEEEEEGTEESETEEEEVEDDVVLEEEEDDVVLEEEEEREWRKIPAAAVRRCYEYHPNVWGQQQRRWVTSM